MLQPRLALTTKTDPENTIPSISVKTEWCWLVLLFIYFSDGEYLKNSWYNICRNISDPKCGHDWKLLKKNLIILLFLWSFTWVANITCNKNIENGWFYFNQCIYIFQPLKIWRMFRVLQYVANATHWLISRIQSAAFCPLPLQNFCGKCLLVV